VVDSADVVVIGSGAFGASAAYHLARRGLRVAVLERAALASQTSPRAAGLSSQVRATPALTKLAQRAVAKLAAFTLETGQPLRFTRSGALKIARTDGDAEQLAREVERGRAAGVPIELVTVSEARERLPILGGRGIRRRFHRKEELRSSFRGPGQPTPDATGSTNSASSTRSGPRGANPGVVQETAFLMLPT